MARAFSTFANGGRRVDSSGFGNHPRAIARISNAEGKMVEDNRPVNRVVLDRDQNALLTSILEARRPLRDRQTRQAGGPHCRGEDRHDGELR